MVSDVIKAAILAGEAELKTKQNAEAAKKAKKAVEYAAYQAKRFAEAENWVREVLPGKIREWTAIGIRYLDVDEYQAYACKQAGLTVTDTWIDSYDDDGYTSYTLKW